MTTLPIERASRWNTPRKLRAYVGAAWLASVLLFGVGLQALRDDRASLQTIRDDTAPGIVLADELGTRLAGLDTELADSMLGSVADREVATELFEMQRSSAARRLVDVANDITAGDVERLPIVIVSEELGRYLEIASQAQRLFVGGDRDGALALLRVASDSMHDRILPAAMALDRVKRDQMDLRYASATRAGDVYAFLALATGGLLIAILAAGQVFVRQRMRRRIAPGLLVASVVALAFTGYLVARFYSAREDLRVARDDAFNSIHTLWKARASAYDARGDESRWLLDRVRALQYESAFHLKTAQLWSDATSRNLSSSEHGLLADEFRNVTFAGESDAAAAAVNAYVDFVGLDDRVRAAESQGRHTEAIELCIGARPDEVRAAFDRLDAEIERTIAVNQDAFDAVLSGGDRSLRRAEWIEPAFMLAIALLTWFGVRPRLREYTG